MTDHVAISAPVSVQNNVKPTVASQVTPSVVPLLWDTPQNSRHSVRVLCDNAGLPLVASVNVDGRMWLPKDIVCAVIGGESGWQNYLPSGQPVTHKNLNADGSLSSTDWGICQINDYWHIGAGKDFPNVAYVLANPAAAVNWMIEMYKGGNIKDWDAYLNGSYKEYLS